VRSLSERTAGLRDADRASEAGGGSVFRNFWGGAIGYVAGGDFDGVRLAY
jgi:hypothetical protein